MRRLLFLLGAIMPALLFAQAPDTSTTEKKARSKILQIRDNTIRAITPGDFRNAFNAITDLSLSRVPSLTLADVKAGEADKSKAFNLIAGKQSGLYIYDPTDASSVEDTALVIRYGTKVFKRQIVNSEYRPEFWNVAADGTTNDYTRLQRAFDAAYTKNGVIVLDGIYMTAGSILIRSDVKGGGTIKTTNNAPLTVGRSGVFVREITIDGGTTGRGLYCDGPNDVTIDGVTVKNVVAQAFWNRKSNRVKIQNCTIDGVTGSYGDAIYFTQCGNPHAINNHGRNYSRIGLVFEGADSTAAAPTNVYCTDVVAIGNTFEGATENADPVNFPNGGIWGENVAGAIITGNVVKNIPARGIVITPSILFQSTYQYVIANNTINNVYDSGGYVGTGLAVSYAENQVVNINNNIITDCRRGIELGYVLTANISGNTFNAKNRAGSWFNTNILIAMLANQTWQSKVNISGCINNVPDSPSRMPVVITNNFNQNLEMRMSDCVGNFGFVMNTSTVTGNISISNCTLDLSPWTAANYNVANVSGTFNLDNCDLTLPANIQIGAVAAKLLINNCRVGTAGTYSRFYLGASGAPYIRVSNSVFNGAWFYDIRRANTDIYIYDSQFDGYSSTKGIFDNTVTQLRYLEMKGCSFSRTNTITPVQFDNGVAESSIGPNLFFSTSLTSGFTPTYQYRSMSRGTTANRPASPQTGYRYHDTTIGREIYWNGTEWLTVGGAPQAFYSTSTTVPAKSLLNSTYGTAKAGSVLFKPLVTGGGRDYTKLDDTATSDWLESIWATGVKSIVP